MKKIWTDEEKKIAEEMLNDIKTRIRGSVDDESLEKVVKKIVNLSKEGLKEKEIVEQIREDIKFNIEEQHLSQYKDA